MSKRGVEQNMESTTLAAAPGVGEGPAVRWEWPSPELAAIYEEHSRMVYYLALRLLGEPAQAEDATHDVFLKAFRRLNRFRGESQIRTWLYRIAINHCQNLLRAWHRRHIFNNVDDVMWDGVVGGGETPLEILATKELGQSIQRCLDELPEEYRILLLLVADERMSYEEVGQLTGQTVDAVRGKLHRARKAFAAAFRRNQR